MLTAQGALNLATIVLQKVIALENVVERLIATVETVRQIASQALAQSFNKAVGDANKAAKTDRDTKVEGLELPNFSLEDMF